MNELEAAIGIGSLKMYHDIIDKRRHNLLTMIKRFQEFDKYLFSIKQEKDELIGPHAFPIIVKEGASFTRDQLVDYYEKNGIDTRDLFSSMPTQCPGFAYLGYKLGDFPNAEFMGNNGLHVGVHQDITDEHIDYLVQVTERFLKEHVQ
jgi:dTDP-4-amino-4,6-dideoxygalactose transaminase